MFCPICKDEFRPGFTRCASCGVDLVDRADAAAPAQAAGNRDAARSAPEVQLHVPMVEYCGFMGLEEARHARDRLKEDRVRSEIVIRESPQSFATDRVTEEFWLRVERDSYKQAVSLLGFDEVEPAGEAESFQCGECGREVVSDEDSCPGCGARFEDD